MQEYLCKGAIPSKLAVPRIWAGRRAGRQLIYSCHQALHLHTEGSAILQHRILSYSCISGLIPLPITSEAAQEDCIV